MPKYDSFFFKNKEKVVELIPISEKKEVNMEIKAFINMKTAAKPISFNFDITKK